MQWFDGAALALEAGKIYSHKDLIDSLRREYPYLKETSYQWGISGLLKNGTIRKIGYNQYEVGVESRKTYVPQYGRTAKELITACFKNFSDVPFVVLETNLFNAFLKKPLLPNTIIMQADKGASLDFFRYLQEAKFPNIMYKPKKKDYDFYKTEDCIIVTDLSSEPPLYSDNPHFICLEKLLIDALCEKTIATSFTDTVYAEMVGDARAEYIVEFPRLLRYARRRNKEYEFLRVCPDATKYGVSAEAKKRNMISDLAFMACSEIRELSEEQQELYDYLGYGKLSLGEIAKLYHVTPQAVNGRMNRLYYSVMRKLNEKYHISEEYVRKTIDYSSKRQFFKKIYDL